MESPATPPPVVSQPSPALRSPRSGLDELLSRLPGTAVVLYALHLLQPTYLVRDQCADERWKWGLLCSLGLAAPTLAWNVFAWFSRSLTKPPSSQP